MREVIQKIDKFKIHQAEILNLEKHLQSKETKANADKTRLI